MNKQNLLSGLALLASMVAIVITITNGSGSPSKTTSEKENVQYLDDRLSTVEQGLREELVAKLDELMTSLDLSHPNASTASPLDGAELSGLIQMAKHDPALARLLKAGIESIILKEMSEELEVVDWLDVLEKEKIQKLLTRTAQSNMNRGFMNSHAPLDLSEIDTVEGKIDRILEEFEGSNTYTHDNALVKQMAELGDEAIEPLLARLEESGQDFVMKIAITDALEGLLTEEYEDVILAEFTKSGQFSDLIKKYQFPAAEDEVMNKIQRPMHGRVDNNVIDTALKMNPDRSIPLLIDHVSNGQNVSYAAEQLAAEGIDITEPLQSASSRANSTWEKAELVELCLEREMPEGYDLAIDVLRSNEAHAQHSQEQVYQYIRKYTGISGSYDEAADWLEENKPQ